MKATGLLLALMLALSAPLSAQPLAPAQEEQIKRGTKKMVVGALLLGAGALMMPLTAPGANAEPMIGLGLAVGGTVVLMWGVKDRYTATRPDLTFGATLGPSRAAFIRRRW